MDQLQAEFESWFSSQHPTSDMRRAPGNDSSYINSCVDWAWKGFRGGLVYGHISPTPDCVKGVTLEDIGESLLKCERYLKRMASDGVRSD